MSAGYLFTCAATFSYAYVVLETGIGALLLFGSVQLTIVLTGLLRGDRLLLVEWAGLLITFSGFVYLLQPELGTPSARGLALMSVAGIAWGLYTLAGRNSSDPLRDTACNFLRTLPFVLVLMAVTLPHAAISQSGVLLAVLSGGIASGLG